MPKRVRPPLTLNPPTSLKQSPDSPFIGLDPSSIVEAETCSASAVEGSNLNSTAQDGEVVTSPGAPAVSVPVVLAPQLVTPDTPLTARDKIASANAPQDVARRLRTLANQDFKFARSADGRQLYRYEAGRYVAFEEGTPWLVDWVDKTLESTWKGNLNSEKFMGQFTYLLQVSQPILWDRPPAGLMSFKNGLLDLSTGSFSPHSPAWLSTIQIPVTYDPAAKCPKWEAMIARIFPDDAIPLAYESVGACLTSDKLVQQALWLQGEGSNGKSTFLTAVAKFLGEENVAVVPLQHLGNDKFASASVLGKLMVMDTETKLDKIEDVSIFKSITSGEEIRAQNKFQRAFAFRPFAKVFLAGNGMPKMDDTSHGLYRRLAIIPFVRTFAAGQKDFRTTDEVLHDLCTPQELSGLLNLALAGWRRLHEQKAFTVSKTVEAETAKHKAAADPLRIFFTTHTEPDPAMEGTQRDVLFEILNEFLKNWGTSLVTMSQFTRWIRVNQPKVYEGLGRRGSRGMQEWTFTTIKTTYNNDDTKHDKASTSAGSE